MSRSAFFQICGAKESYIWTQHLSLYIYLCVCFVRFYQLHNSMMKKFGGNILSAPLINCAMQILRSTSHIYLCVFICACARLRRFQFRSRETSGMKLQVWYFLSMLHASFKKFYRYFDVPENIQTFCIGRIAFYINPISEKNLFWTISRVVGSLRTWKHFSAYLFLVNDLWSRLITPAERKSVYRASCPCTPPIFYPFIPPFLSFWMRLFLKTLEVIDSIKFFS